MLGHLGLNVADLAAAKRYYDRVLPLLDFESYLVHDDELAYRPAGGRPGTYLFIYPADGPGEFAGTAVGLQHLAFMARSRSAVRAVHDLVAGLGSPIVHEPREWPEYPPPYYATFWLDPSGFLLEAVCHHDRD